MSVNIRDLSLSGAGISLDPQLCTRFQRGDVIGVRIGGVGTLKATVARVGASFIGIHFDLPESLERDLLIRKIFTDGLNAHTATTAALSTVTFGMLRRIWSARTEVRLGPPAAAEAPAPKEEKLPAQTLVLPPRRRETTFAELAADRRLAA